MFFKNDGISAVETDGRVVSGFASIFGNVDHGGDIVHAGAFKKTLSERGDRIKHLWNHGQQFWDYFVTPPIAKILEIREVGRDELPDSVMKKAPKATGGLLVKREYLATPTANEVLASIQAGVNLEMSFGYDVVKHDYETLSAGTPEQMYVRNLRELMIYDTSDVNFGMNSGTVADGSKSQFALGQIGDRVEELARWMRRSKSLPKDFHKEFARVKALFLSLKSDGDPDPEPPPPRENSYSFVCPCCDEQLMVSKSDGDPDPEPPPPRENSDSRAEGTASLTVLMAQLKELESSV